MNADIKFKARITLLLLFIGVTFIAWSVVVVIDVISWLSFND